MFNPSLPRENADAQAVSTDGRATIYANGQAHMFERKVVIKKQRRGFKYKKNKTIYFFFSYLKRYSNTYTFLQDSLLNFSGILKRRTQTPGLKET
jgi:hypothetical protein